MTYSPSFFADQSPIALKSAHAILPGVLDDLPNISTVVDVGCGVAAWASVAMQYGCEVHGVDGNVPEHALLIAETDFERADLRAGFDCKGYDLAICLEVAEHLPETSAEALVRGLCGAPYVLFSGAHPGQGGIDHQHERWGTYWEQHFNQYGYLGSSELKWRHWNDPLVQDYYRENILLFAPPDYLETAGYTPGVVDVLHPIRYGQWP